MTNNARYWIWLALALKEGAKFKEVIEEFGSVEGLYDANIIEWRQSSTLTPSQINRLEATSLDLADEIISACNENNWQIISYDDEKYPQRLRDIPNPPAVLYVDGEMPDVDNSVEIAVVGTRKASKYALNCAYFMSKGISKCGAIVVSGGALGVDAASHKGALSEGAVTIAVLGNGFGSSYLKANEELRRDIIKNGGALVTEFPPYKRPDRCTFPLRNRIISGLSLGTLVVEAGEKSGSLITARLAREQGRDIYAIPASIFDDAYLGTNKLIDEGATVATAPSVLIKKYANEYNSIDMSRAKSIRELVGEYASNDANAPKMEITTFDNIKKDRNEAVKRQEMSFELDGNERLIYNVLDQSYMTVDQIIEKSNCDVRTVLSTLTMLEIKKLIESAPGKRYRLK